MKSLKLMFTFLLLISGSLLAKDDNEKVVFKGEEGGEIYVQVCSSRSCRNAVLHMMVGDKQIKDFKLDAKPMSEQILLKDKRFSVNKEGELLFNKEKVEFVPSNPVYASTAKKVKMKFKEDKGVKINLLHINKANLADFEDLTESLKRANDLQVNNSGKNQQQIFDGSREAIDARYKNLLKQNSNSAAQAAQGLSV